MSTCHVGCAAQLAGQLVVLAQEGRQPQRSDRRFPNLSCPWALEAVWLTRRRRADFHQGPERTMKLLKQAEYMAATASPPTRQSPFARGWVHIRTGVRRAWSLLRRCYPAVQHDDFDGPSDAKRPAVLRPVRARG